MLVFTRSERYDAEYEKTCAVLFFCSLRYPACSGYTGRFLSRADYSGVSPEWGVLRHTQRYRGTQLSSYLGTLAPELQQSFLGHLSAADAKIPRTPAGGPSPHDWFAGRSVRVTPCARNTGFSRNQSCMGGSERHQIWIIADHTRRFRPDIESAFRSRIGYLQASFVQQPASCLTEVLIAALQKQSW